MRYGQIALPPRHSNPLHLVTRPRTTPNQIICIEHEVVNTLRDLKTWMKPERVGTPGWLAPAWSEVRREPMGVVLVISPFNYPLQVSRPALIHTKRRLSYGAVRRHVGI